MKISKEKIKSIIKEEVEKELLTENIFMKLAGKLFAKIAKKYPNLVTKFPQKIQKMIITKIEAPFARKVVEKFADEANNLGGALVSGKEITRRMLHSSGFKDPKAFLSLDTYLETMAQRLRLLSGNKIPIERAREYVRKDRVIFIKIHNTVKNIMQEMLEHMQKLRPGLSFSDYLKMIFAGSGLKGLKTYNFIMKSIAAGVSASIIISQLVSNFKMTKSAATWIYNKVAGKQKEASK